MKLFFEFTLFLSLLWAASSLKTSTKNHSVESKTSLRAGSRRAEDAVDCGSVMDIICSLQNTRTFCDMVTQAANDYATFREGLSGDRPYTVFAPTDEAFTAYEAELVQLNPDEIYRTLLFHFYEDIVLTNSELACQAKLTSLTGDTSRVKCRRKTAGVYTKYQRGKGNKELDDYPLIDSKSKEACSGIIHRIDHILLPEVFKPFEELVVVQEGGAVAETPEVEEDVDTEEVQKEEPTVVEDDEDEAEEEPVFEEPAGVEQVNNNVVATETAIIAAVETEEEVVEPEEPTVVEDGGTTEVITEHTLDGIDFKRDKECRNCVAGTSIEVTEVTSVQDETTVKEAEAVEEKKGTRIGALGINLIIFSTLLLCFVFVCMRR